MTPRPRRGPPPWWPEGEAWPPRDRSWHWRRHRGRFIGRFGLLFSLIWLLTMIGATTVVSRIAPAAFATWPEHGRPWRGAAVAMIAIAVVAFVAFVRRVGSPMGDLVAAARRVADGDFTVRVAEHGPPALRAVAAAFNNMAMRLQRQEGQRRELMADIAHELRTPLSIVQGRLEGLIDGVYPRDASQLEPLLDETRVLARLVEDLRTLANAESGVLTLDREQTDIGMLVRDAVGAVAADAAREGIAISIDDKDAAAPVNVDPVRIRQVLVNLLSNAIRHGGKGSTVAVTVRVADGSLVVRVADTGPGIAPADLPKIFDRFYKRSGSTGSGLGLTIARSLVRAHGGSISAESTLDSGTSITITVPTASAD